MILPTEQGTDTHIYKRIHTHRDRQTYMHSYTKTDAHIDTHTQRYIHTCSYTNTDTQTLKYTYIYRDILVQNGTEPQTTVPRSRHRDTDMQSKIHAYRDIQNYTQKHRHTQRGTYRDTKHTHRTCFIPCSTTGTLLNIVTQNLNTQKLQEINQLIFFNQTTSIVPVILLHKASVAVHLNLLKQRSIIH